MRPTARHKRIEQLITELEEKINRLEIEQQQILDEREEYAMECATEATKRAYVRLGKLMELLPTKEEAQAIVDELVPELNVLFGTMPPALHRGVVKLKAIIARADEPPVVESEE